MGSDEGNDRLSRIETLWPCFQKAHAGTADEQVAAAQWTLLERYRGAVYRYLLGAVRDTDSAEELFQEFALRFLRGDFRRANPQRGRFRDYVKTALINLVNDYHRRRKDSPGTLPLDVAGPTATEADDRFVRRWSKELLDQVWPDLQKANPTHYAVLRFYTQNPDAQSGEASEKLSAELGRAISQANVRVMLHRAREKFADLLVDEVRRSLEDPSEEDLLAELDALGLKAHCGPSLAKRKK